MPNRAGQHLPLLSLVYLNMQPVRRSDLYFKSLTVYTADNTTPGHAARCRNGSPLGYYGRRSIRNRRSGHRGGHVFSRNWPHTNICIDRSLYDSEYCGCRGRPISCRDTISAHARSEVRKEQILRRARLEAWLSSSEFGLSNDVNLRLRCFWSFLASVVASLLSSLLANAANYRLHEINPREL